MEDGTLQARNLPAVLQQRLEVPQQPDFHLQQTPSLDKMAG